ncbi:CDP-glucose 4,6-dehydratase [Streptomyces hainanensis]|nr:CDP-glucose 4,6-dehydratase [Streptomyces hainanensis]
MADSGLRTRWDGRRVLISGHSGFVGSWLAMTLRHLNAEVDGFALNDTRATRDRHTWLTAHGVKGHLGDIRDFDAVHRVMSGAPYDAVFHLAAQPVVRVGWEDPHTTLTTNINGSVNILEAARRCAPSVLVHVTSDKCYRNRAWPWPYRETDEMGGGCPYSVSKAAAELVFEGYAKLLDASRPRVASVRFGNIIGGGDHTEHRLVPDTVAALSSGTPIRLRRATAVRPWQHVLDVVRGLLLLADALDDGTVAPGTALNFAPPGDGATAGELATTLAAHWTAAVGREGPTDEPVLLADGFDPGFVEEELLRLDGRLAAAALDWHHRYGLDDAAAAIVDWHRSVLAGTPPQEATAEQIARFFAHVPSSSPADPTGGTRA